MQTLLMVFDRQTFSQTLREQFDEDERDLELLNAAVDCIVDMLKCTGPTPAGFEIFKMVYPKMTAMTKQV
jgi:hypothetical protein